MKPTPTKAPEVWQELLTSGDSFSEFSDIYSSEFLVGLAAHFDRNPHPVDLLRGVLSTGHAYVSGKWLKLAESSKFLQYSGVHLIGAGLSARRLSEELGQVTKSERAAQAVHANLRAILDQDTSRPHAAQAYQAAIFRNGPQARLEVIRELASALEAAIGQIIGLPSDYDEEPDTRQRAFDFVTEANRTATKTLPKNYAMEEAARVFQPLWEEFSSAAYRRGRYRHEIGGYDCKPGNALFAIITKLDSTVAPSLAGTAIENLHTQSKVAKRSD